jgi:type I restriction enzyme S subunit
MDSLNTGILKGVPILLPPIGEQRQLLRTIARTNETLRQAMIDAQQAISAVREYRTRLISDVVTGKLDVREAAARLPEAIEERDALETESEADSEEAQEEGDLIAEEADA